MSVRETAEVLGVSEDVVKTRLSRARRQLRRILLPEIGGLFQETLPFAGAGLRAHDRAGACGA
ncbi:sigma factor-like helix-turn-helix DNA-binding protein [Roseovarius confluentis]|uniref:sigma factor-like helix-turn-helix DNA-binding protein n=1 Tax=Roseovarius confluentis TaxID=1852027 RepID=UPI003BAC2473